jgi:hypothetical protein
MRRSPWDGDLRTARPTGLRGFVLGPVGGRAPRESALAAVDSASGSTAGAAFADRFGAQNSDPDVTVSDKIFPERL